jgi:FAD/FMN-containing dehydrogenase
MAIGGLQGRCFERGSEHYENARRACVWNARMPERLPDLVVQAASEEDVVLAVRHAAQNGLRIGVRSGGHSWAGSHVRDGGLLLDVSRLHEVSVNREAMTAEVGPGCHGDELLSALAGDDLFFPAGHCPGVGLGGYLLQGGYGWNGRVHGPACESVEAIDVVTARGELVRADDSSHPDLYWAARGAGPGFFGVVTRFHVRLQPRPRVVANGLHLYALDDLEAVFTWAAEIAPRVPRAMEMMLFIHRDDRGEPEIAVTGPVLMDSEEQAREALALLETCPVAARAKAAVPYAPAQIADLYAAAGLSYPDDHRYAVDNMWTHAPVAELLPGLRRIGEQVPAAPSHMLWMNWGPSPERQDMAYSVEDETYIALYAVGSDPADDAANLAWAEDNMRAMEHLASGIQLADENLGRRPARFLSDAHCERVDRVRAQYDPDGLFHSWMGAP